MENQPTPKSEATPATQNPPRDFFATFTLTATERIKARTLAEAQAIAEDMEAPPLSDFLSEQAPEVFDMEAPAAPLDLSGVPLDSLIAELYRRQRAGGCAVVVITPDDVREQWKTNQDAEETDEPAPTDAEMCAALRLVQRYLEKTVYENEPAFEWGPMSDACELISRWRKEGGSK